MPRFISWLAIELAAVFLVVATAAFTLQTVATLAFAISIGTLIVSAGIGYRYRRHAPTLVTAGLVAEVSAWTVIASLVFSLPTVQALVLGGSLAIAGLSLVGLTVHELSRERVAGSTVDSARDSESRLAAAA